MRRRIRQIALSIGDHHRLCRHGVPWRELVPRVREVPTDTLQQRSVKVPEHREAPPQEVPAGNGSSNAWRPPTKRSRARPRKREVSAHHGGSARPRSRPRLRRSRASGECPPQAGVPLPTTRVAPGVLRRRSDGVEQDGPTLHCPRKRCIHRPWSAKATEFPLRKAYAVNLHEYSASGRMALRRPSGLPPTPPRGVALRTGLASKVRRRRSRGEGGLIPKT